MAEKNSFVLYGDYLQHVQLLSDAEAGGLFRAILLYANGKPLPELSPLQEMAFSFIRAQMDKDNDKYERTVEARREAGKLGGRPRKAQDNSEKQTKAKKANGFFEKQTKAKKPDNDNVNDNVLKENTLKGVKEKRFAPPTLEDVSGHHQRTKDGAGAEGSEPKISAQEDVMGRHREAEPGVEDVMGCRQKPESESTAPEDVTGRRCGNRGNAAGQRFVPPTPEEVVAYCRDNGYDLDAERFVDFYASKGWKIGSSPMKDWKAAVRNWARRDRENNAESGRQTAMSAGKAHPKNQFHNFDQRQDMDYDALVLEQAKEWATGGGSSDGGN